MSASSIKNLCLISDFQEFPVGVSRHTRILRKFQKLFGTWLIQRRAKKILKQYSNSVKFSGKVSPTILKVFQSNSRKDLLQDIAEDYNTILERTDFASIHRFSDDLHEWALKLGSDSGLTWKSQSVFRNFEIRWVDPLFNNYVSCIEVVRDILDSVEKNDSQKGLNSTPNEIIAFSDRSFIETVAAREYARNLNIPFRVFHVNFFEDFLLSLLQKSSRTARTKQAYDFLLQDWLQYTTDQKVSRPKYSETKKPRILFVIMKYRSIKRLEALFDVLNEQYQVCIWVTLKGQNKSLDEVVELLESKGAQVFFGSDYITKTEAKKLANHIDQFSELDLAQYLKSEKKFFYRNIDLAPYMEKILRDLIIKGSSVSALYSEVTDRLFTNEKFSMVVNFEEWEINRSISQRARAFGIPTIAYYFLAPTFHCNLIRRMQDFLAAPGQSLADGFKDNPGWKNRSRVIGDPLDAKAASLDRTKIRNRYIQEYHLSPQKKKLLVLTSYSDTIIRSDDIVKFYSNCLKAASNLDLEVIFKIHPQQSTYQVLADLKGLGYSTPVFFEEADLIELAAACDICAAIATTATNQVILAKTPIVCMMPVQAKNQLDEIYGYHRKGAIPLLNVEDDPTEVFKKILTDNLFRESQIEKALNYVTDHVGPLDGRTSERFREFLNEVSN